MEILIGFLVALFTQFVKPKLASPLAIQGTVFFIALVVTMTWQYAQGNPAFMDFLMSAFQTTLAAVGLYEIILKRLDTEEGETA